jgi:hypothetical protein
MRAEGEIQLVQSGDDEDVPTDPQTETPDF